jgi:hypothetical protein
MKAEGGAVMQCLYAQSEAKSLFSLDRRSSQQPFIALLTISNECLVA